ncbi:MAG: hypothetical protein A2504_10145 [Bdellovibrionales bacterium RIFOXYD12_FULL_39_22]|nr:MAG: hypothetical protein A2385_17780 [Bdellovibrionales bacterium RIFOXYB1_FULL_39_21]OFZ43970.1 MAG: hypothetical protein A2485_04450 [Bdellovibrionales bacterium RIFOXYC12_FULL_39_17]OFZ48342.1 MAG: hypothetical protein A2404_01865 [Bdellovibrionales bacterium RIFOXYC1_FULL_39_130]OFZ76647.1 MAG: hypothetical protein A2560_17460 [Bdellovibrionales bacterium RIFOXYD1_FULL_39_84]OFZ94933.1 MAG: hypothetical protein A2504_10145 [Bdellovibrionales bacterium RIFOXYD12_FULL_39_22]HLE12645.1 me
MRILLIGDIHGDIHHLPQRLALMRSQFRVSAAICLGDFGFFPDIFATLSEESFHLPIPLYTIDGNHEDHHWLAQMAASGAIETWRTSYNLIYQPRGSVAQIGNSTVGLLGGALNIDRPQQIDNFSSVSNTISATQRLSASSAFNHFHPELIVTHSSPAGIGVGMCGELALKQSITNHVVSVGFDPGPDNDCGEIELANLWHSLEQKPAVWAFGHFHKFHETKIEDTTFVCVPMLSKNSIWPIIMWDSDEKRIIIIKQ